MYKNCRSHRDHGGGAAHHSSGMYSVNSPIPSHVQPGEGVGQENQLKKYGSD